jgi:hypothetical protein
MMKSCLLWLNLRRFAMIFGSRVTKTSLAAENLFLCEELTFLLRGSNQDSEQSGFL